MIFVFVCAHADFVRFEAGAGFSSTKAGGDVKYEGNQDFSVKDDLGLDSKSSEAYFWAMLKHPAPVLPNLRFETFSYKQSSKATKSVSWGGQTYSQSAKTKLNLRQNDLIAYYSLLDNTFWTTLDLGLDVRMMSGEFVVGDKSADANFVLPLGYARARVNIPATGFGAEASLKYVSYDGSSVQDIIIKADYVFDLSVLDLGVEFGLKRQKSKIDTKAADIKGNIDLDTTFAGVVAKF
ncbi:MAG: hypothetical protein CSA19_01580 [Deltaproteobacteria bacterium]|nr:MAG: hypothetical protein CSA19_01580 [Deltaproteobacteria bacterium]